MRDPDILRRLRDRPLPDSTAAGLHRIDLVALRGPCRGLENADTCRVPSPQCEPSAAGL